MTHACPAAAVPADGAPPAAPAPNGAAAAFPEARPSPADPLRHNRGNRSTIAGLPPAVRAELCAAIRAGTPDSAIAADFRARGYAVSRSAIYRFRKSAAAGLADWSRMRDAAALWSDGGIDAALAEMLRVAAFAVMARMDPAAPDVADSARAVARLVRAARDLAAAGAARETAAAPEPRRGAPGSIDDPRLPSLPPPDTWDADAQAAAAVADTDDNDDNPPDDPQPWWDDEDWEEYAERQNARRIAREAKCKGKPEARPEAPPEREDEDEREGEPPPDGEPDREPAPRPAAKPRKLPPCLAAAAPPILPNRPFEPRRRSLYDRYD